MPLWTEPGFYARSPCDGSAGSDPHGLRCARYTKITTIDGTEPAGRASAGRDGTLRAPAGVQRGSAGVAGVAGHRRPGPPDATPRGHAGHTLLTPAQLAAVADGQLIRMLRPAVVRAIWTSSARPSMTARPSSAGTACRAGSPAASAAHRRRLAAAVSPRAGGRAGRAVLLAPAVSVTTTSNRPLAPVSATRTGSAGQCSWCASTAREQASPPRGGLRRGAPRQRRCACATAVATSRAVRTCAGSGVKLISTVAMVVDRV